jgi:hypothetical protein
MLIFISFLGVPLPDLSLGMAHPGLFPNPIAPSLNP